MEADLADFTNQDFSARTRIKNIEPDVEYEDDKWSAFVDIEGFYFFQRSVTVWCGNYRHKWMAKFMAKLNAKCHDYIFFWNSWFLNCDTYDIYWRICKPKE